MTDTAFFMIAFMARELVLGKLSFPALNIDKLAYRLYLSKNVPLAIQGLVQSTVWLRYLEDSAPSSTIVAASRQTHGHWPDADCIGRNLSSRLLFSQEITTHLKFSILWRMEVSGAHVEPYLAVTGGRGGGKSRGILGADSIIKQALYLGLSGLGSLRGSIKVDSCILLTY